MFSSLGPGPGAGGGARARAPHRASQGPSIYIKLPINRPCGRYVIDGGAQPLMRGSEESDRVELLSDSACCVQQYARKIPSPCNCQGAHRTMSRGHINLKLELHEQTRNAPTTTRPFKDGVD